MSGISKKLPVAITSFEMMIHSDFLYVDKTKFIAEIVEGHGPYFISRPRRFGKSTLVDTLFHYFNGEKELFKDTYIGRNNLYSKDTYKVVRLDFSKIKEKKAEPFAHTFKKMLKQSLIKAGIDFNIDDTDSSDPEEFFDNAVIDCPTGSLVLLIDEYDAPLTTVLNNSLEFENRRSIFSQFYSIVKANSDKFRFIFITGVAKYHHLSIFSAFNNLTDLTFKSKYGALLGYTQEELETYFRPYIERAALVLNEDCREDKYTYQTVLEEMRRYYDGYSFDLKCKTHVYNPWSILSFLDDPESGFKPYWYDTGGAKPALLVQYLNKISNSVTKEPNFENFLNLDYEHEVDVSDLSPEIESADSPDFGLLPILYQAGYFSIKKRSESDFVKIGIPNLEIKRAFAKIVIDLLIAKDADSATNKTAAELARYFKNKNTQEIKDFINKLINNLSYDGIASFNEASYRDFIVTILFFSKAKHIVKENVTASGRSDLVFEFDEHVFVCELKIAHSENEVLKLKEKAFLQIKNKKYDVLPTSKTVHACVMIILHQVRTDKSDSCFEVRELSIE